MKKNIKNYMASYFNNIITVLTAYNSKDKKPLQPKLPIETIIINKFNLTPKELVVLKAICDGKINKEIADELNLSINTIKFHVKKIYAKLDTSTRQETRRKYFSAI